MVISPKEKYKLPNTTHPQKQNSNNLHTTAEFKYISALQGRTVNTQNNVANSRRKMTTSKPLLQKYTMTARMRLTMVKMILLRLAHQLSHSPSHSLRQLSKASLCRQFFQDYSLSPHFGFIANTNRQSTAKVSTSERQERRRPTTRKAGSATAPSLTSWKNCRLLKIMGKMKTNAALMNRLYTPTSQKILLAKLFSPFSFHRSMKPIAPVSRMMKGGNAMATKSMGAPPPLALMASGLIMSMPQLIFWQVVVFWLSWYMKRQQICRNSMKMCPSRVKQISTQDAATTKMLSASEYCTITPAFFACTTQLYSCNLPPPTASGRMNCTEQFYSRVTRELTDVKTQEAAGTDKGEGGSGKVAFKTMKPLSRSWKGGRVTGSEKERRKVSGENWMSFSYAEMGCEQAERKSRSGRNSLQHQSPLIKQSHQQKGMHILEHSINQLPNSYHLHALIHSINNQFITIHQSFPLMTTLSYLSFHMPFYLSTFYKSSIIFTSIYPASNKQYCIYPYIISHTMSYDGLAHCSISIMASSPICIEKALECSFTLLLLIAIVINLVMRISYERQLNLYVLISLLMIFTLVCNFLNTLFAEKEVYRFQDLFFNAYFPTLVYKFGLKLLEKNKATSSKYRRIIVIFYILYLLLVLIDFIYVNVQDTRNCKEIPYMVVNASGVTLSIWLVIFGYQHTKSQIIKNDLIKQQIMGDSQRYTNPMPKMWKCIIINILSQAIGLARTIYYVSTPAMNCKFTYNAAGEAAIQFVILVTTYYIGMIATLFFFDEKRRSYFHWNSRNNRKSSDEQKVELINVSNFQAKDGAVAFDR